MCHQRKCWTANGRDLFREVVNIIFSQMFQNGGCGITSWDNLIHDKRKNSENNTLPIVLFTDAPVNLIKKGLWSISCCFLKFNEKPIFGYQNIHLLYGPIRKNLDFKGHRRGYNKIIGRLWSTNCGTRIEWEASRKGAWLNKACREHRKMSS